MHYRYCMYIIYTYYVVLFAVNFMRLKLYGWVKYCGLRLFVVYRDNVNLPRLTIVGHSFAY